MYTCFFKWWRVLDECGLLNSVDITCNQDLFISFMIMIDQFPHRATQVENLYLFDSAPAGFNRRTLLDTFPNLRVLTVEYEKESYNSRPIHIKQSTSKLKILNDSTNCEITSQLLTSNLGGNLEQLYLNFKSVGGISTRILLDQLGSFSVLKHLHLHAFSLRINDLENIQYNIPSIHVFGHYNITVADSQMPVSILPATSIVTLNIDIDHADNVNTHVQLYQYMTAKYCNVDSIEFNDRELSNYHDDNRRLIYLDGIMDFYKLIAPKQTSFNIHDVPDGFNVLDIFDEMGCKLEELAVTKCQEEILQHLSHSNQSNVHLNYIDTLGILCKSVDCTLANTISSCFPNLVNLTLQGQITENICITLASPSFQKAKFSIPWVKPHGITFKAPNQVLPQHYIIAKSRCKLVEYENIRHLPVLTVTCFTEKILKFSNWVEILSI